MSDDGTPAGKETPCCADPSCCGGDKAAADDSCCGSGSSSSRLKTLLFVLVVAAAVTVAVVSVMRKRREQADTPATARQDTAVDVLLARQGYKDMDFAFVVLPGEDAEAAAELAATVDTAVQTLTQRGEKVGQIVCPTGSPDHAGIVKAWSAASLPAVVAARLRCGADLVTGKVTVESLLTAYVDACGSKPCGGGT